METSTCPPRIIPKDSVLSNVAAPGTKVTVSFPALMISLFSVRIWGSLFGWMTYGSTSSSVG